MGEEGGDWRARRRSDPLAELVMAGVPGGAAAPASAGQRLVRPDPVEPVAFRADGGRRAVTR